MEADANTAVQEGSASSKEAAPPEPGPTGGDPGSRYKVTLTALVAVSVACLMLLASTVTLAVVVLGQGHASGAMIRRQEQFIDGQERKFPVIPDCPGCPREPRRGLRIEPGPDGEEREYFEFREDSRRLRRGDAGEAPPAEEGEGGKEES